MLNEYLFRGKRTDDGKWVYGNVIDDSGMLFITGMIINRTPMGSNRHSITLYYVDPDTVGRCTSLRDKNGTSIFEGDILKQNEDEFVAGAIDFVYWGRCGFSVSIRSLQEPHIIDEFLPLSEVNEYGTVIGNIHDNPELLKEGQNDAGQYAGKDQKDE